MCTGNQPITFFTEPQQVLVRFCISLLIMNSYSLRYSLSDLSTGRITKNFKQRRSFVTQYQRTSNPDRHNWKKETTQWSLHQDSRTTSTQTHAHTDKHGWIWWPKYTNAIRSNDNSTGLTTLVLNSRRWMRWYLSLQRWHLSPCSRSISDSSAGSTTNQDLRKGHRRW